MQQEIYDESDKYERDALRIARHVSQHWKSYVRRRQRQRNSEAPVARQLSMGTVVELAIEANEHTGLLGGGKGKNDNKFNPLGSMKQFFDNLTKKE